MKTKAKILSAATELFNRQGERSITTNHIAEHINISPGNLYYYYRNKSEIVAEIFDQYKASIENLFITSIDQGITLDVRTKILQQFLETIWQYRFFHRDLVGILAADEALKIRYQALANHIIANIEALYRALITSGVMAIPDAQIKAFALNVWMVTTGWITYLKSVKGTVGHQLTTAQLNEMIYQVIALEAPYMTVSAR